MLRILGQISIFGTKAGIERFISLAPIPNGAITRVGGSRIVPDVDSWCYASPWYRFRGDTLDDEIRHFLITQGYFGSALITCGADITYAFFTLCPIEQNEDEAFSCLLQHETLNALADSALAFQIAPASVMPDVAYWLKKDS